ncbi:MAG: hypothetical protein HPY84_00660 [Syntrophobacteraceae bacterium]|nr:hypothetical protein [Syntrophobacteraceae bacterium]
MNRLKRFVLFFVPIFGLFLSLGVYSACADEPAAVMWKVLEAAKSGNYSAGVQARGDARVMIGMSARPIAEKTSLLVLLYPSEDARTAGKPISNLEEVLSGKETSARYHEWKDPGPRWRANPSVNAVLLKPGAKSQFMIEVDFLREVAESMSVRVHGKVFELSRADLAQTQDPLELAFLMHGRQHASSFAIDLYYALQTGGKWTFGSYAEIFGAGVRSIQQGKSTADYQEMAAVLPVNLIQYRRNLRLPAKFKDDGGAMFNKTLSKVLGGGSATAGDEFCFSEDIETSGRQVAREGVGEALTASYSHTLRGRFSTKWSSDHSLHPGFGFKVEAWTNETGSWKKLASGWVEVDGYWQLQVPSSLGYQGKQLRVVYLSYNSYYAPQDQSGSKYAWKDPDRENIPTNYDAGHRYADTDGGAYNGVGELVEAAMFMWSRLYWDAGINPVPSSPIKLYFPNTWYDCGDGTGSPWSCANASGEIWLIAAHGIQAEVVTHELSHQLNNKFWGNKKPAGSGGSHSLTGCYPTRLGMALREGFAEFIPAWVGYPSRNVAEGGFSSGRWNLGYDIETRFSPPACSNGWENELWVARTFWDLHDTRSDGDDILWFTHKGAVIAIYLGNGIASDGDARDMRYYENIYRDAASAGHESFITDIFEQNRM